MLLLTRSVEENMEAAVILSRYGFDSILANMFSYNDYAWDNMIHAQTILVTSKHASRIISNHYHAFADCWVVGSYSASILSCNPKLHVTKIMRNAFELRDEILISARNFNIDFSNFLYLSGNVITCELPHFITRRVIYETTYHDIISREVIEAIMQYRIRYIATFSTNCAIHLIDLLKRYNLTSYVENIVVIAISAKVAALFHGLVRRCIYSEQHSFDDMLKLLIKYEKDNDKRL